MEQTNGQYDEVAAPSGGRETIADISARLNAKADSVSRAWRRAREKGADLPPFDCYAVPTDYQLAQVPTIAALYGVQVKAKSGKAGKQAKVDKVALPGLPKANSANAAKGETFMGKIEGPAMLILPGVVTLLSVALSVSGLYMFAQWAGAMLGSMFGLALVSSVIVARNRMKGLTSEQALNTVFWMEFGAFFLHCFTFNKLLPTAVGEWGAYITMAAAMICAGFSSFLSYRAVIMVRNYNAEV